METKVWLVTVYSSIAKTHSKQRGTVEASSRKEAVAKFRKLHKTAGMIHAASVIR